MRVLLSVLLAVIVALVSTAPRSPEDYKARLPASLGLEHISVEIHRDTGSDGD